MNDRSMAGKIETIKKGVQNVFFFEYTSVSAKLLKNRISRDLKDYSRKWDVKFGKV